MTAMRLINKIRKLFQSIFFLPFIFKRMVKIFSLTAKKGKGSGFCLEKGFLPVPVHFYSSIPDIGDLENRKIWDVRSDLMGIDFRENAQIELIEAFGRSYSSECQWPLYPTENMLDFYIDNQSFSYGCAASTHCMIRHYNSSVVIEIGSGMSSKVISNALLMNRSEKGHNNKHIIIDPFPADFIKNGSLESCDVVESRVEVQALSFFNKLKKNDILFIDSGHCVKIGGDVNFLFLDILPRLSPGVIVHFHDIGIPYEYPKTYSTSETFRQFWTEQYLLQGFLCFNSEFEVLMAMNYLMTDHMELFKKVFPYFNADIHRFLSSSFWIKRKE